MSTSSEALCKYFLRGTCRFGEFCRFTHPLPPIENNINNSQETMSTNKSSSSSNSNLKATSDTDLIQSKTSLNTSDPSSWVMAPVFVPRQASSSTASIDLLTPITGDAGAGAVGVTADATTYKTYAEVAGGGETSTSGRNDFMRYELCQYGDYCTLGKHCGLEHGKLCDLCGRFSLHPTDKEKRRKHIDACIQQHEKDMEISFAIARSKDKTCGICFDMIVDKAGREKRFGILPNCNHVFCLSCIRKWRQSKQFESKITRSCPECRTPSDFVCPSPYWVDTKEDKTKLISAYKVALGKKDCKYFKKGEGKCPFGNKCFYKHALANGQLVDVGVPQKLRKVHRSDEEILELFDQVFPQIYLWDFVDQRELLAHALESDDSDWSDDDLFE